MRRHLKLLLALLLAFAMVGAACGDDDDDDAAGTDNGSEDEGSGSGSGQPDIVIGAQDFGESAIMAEIYKGALVGGGWEASIQELGGFRDLMFSAFENGDITVAPDYVASNLEFLNEGAGEATADVDATFALLQPRLEEKGLVGLTPSAAVDHNAFVMKKSRSDELGITTLSDLAAKGANLKLGAPQDCESNGFCIPGLQRVYGVDFTSNFTPLDLDLVPTTLDAGEIDVAVLTSTDGNLADHTDDWVVLDDDKAMLAADNIFPVVTQEVADSYGAELTDMLNDVSAKLTTEGVAELNKRYVIDKEDADVIAKDLLEENGFTTG
jgi:osmoprotectant transport system substrate-binding protein